MPPVKVFWYDRMEAVPKFDGVPEGELIGDKDINGSLFIGDKGMVTTGCYGENTRLVPAERMKDYKLPPQLLSRAPGPEKEWVRGHYRDWIRACKGGEPACSNFSVSGPFAQWMLLGVDRDADRRRQAGVGRPGRPLHEQQRGERPAAPEVPQRLEVRLESAVRNGACLRARLRSAP